MVAFIIDNLGTVLVFLTLCALVAGVIVSLVKKKGTGCASCACGHCCKDCCKHDL